MRAINIRNRITIVLTSIFIVGMNASGTERLPQDHSTETVRAPSQGSESLSGCYQLTSLSWSPQVEDLSMIPTGFELSSDPTARGATYFKLRSLDVKTERDRWESLWNWRPRGSDKLEINLGAGLGGFRGTLAKSGRDELVGKVKEYCDSRCGYKRRIGKLRLRKISCGPS